MACGLQHVGPGIVWYHRTEQVTGQPSWTHFFELVNLCFGPPAHSNPLGELMSLHHDGTVEDHCEQFMALLCRAGRLMPKKQINNFIAGLLEPLKTDVELEDPKHWIRP